MWLLQIWEELAKTTLTETHPKPLALLRIIMVAEGLLSKLPLKICFPKGKMRMIEEALNNQCCRMTPISILN
jgi:hypothetical protein